MADLHLPRILCLHGGGVNAEVFRLQCRGLCRALETSFRFVFVDAPYLSPADPGIMAVFGDFQPFRRWLRWQVDQPNPGPEAICRDIDLALDDAMAVDSALGATGDWVAVMGFSQGAKVAASLLLRQRLLAEKLPAAHNTTFKFGIILAGRAPLVALHPGLTDSLALADADELTTGAFAQVTGSTFLQGSDHLLTIPTLHVHGMKDPGLAYHQRLLTDYCQSGTTRLVEWEGDHRVVIKSADVAAVVDAIVALAKETGCYDT